MTTETFAFQAEINQLMSLIINTFYSNKDIYLRELISNSSDAIDKIRYQSLSDPTVLNSGSDFFIKLIPNKNEKTLTIYDSGIGMTKEDLINNLGTIAKSGTKSFMEAVQSGKDVPSMIGQFGVGFYSAFLVADSVKVITKNNNDNQYVWESKAGGSFTISSSENEEPIERGTKIILTLKDDLLEYLDDSKIKKLVKKHSEFINYPISLYSLVEENEPEPETNDEEVTELNEETKVEEVIDEKPKKMREEWNLLNKNKPLWTKNSKEVTNEEYSSFYKSVYGDWEDHLAVKHFKVEGNVEFTGLIFFPKRPPFNFMMEQKKKDNFKLYVKRVFIMDDCDELVPEWLNFAKGLVDSEDLPLNISREILQHNRVLRVIKKNMVKKAIDLMDEISTDETKFKLFYESFDKNIKYGIHEDSENRERLSSLLRFDSTNGKFRSFDNYISSMPENQQDIYFISGESIKAVENSPFLEVLKKKGFEVLFFVDPIDEYMISNLKEYKGKNLACITREGLTFPETEEEKQERENLAASYQDLCKNMKELLPSVEKVQVGQRIIDSPCVLLTSNYGLSANMERITKAQALNTGFNPMATSKKILEINPKNPIIQNLKSRFEANPNDRTIRDLTQLLYEMTLLTSGFSLEDPTSFANRISRMIHLGLQIDESVNEDCCAVPETIHMECNEDYCTISESNENVSEMENID